MAGGFTVSYNTRSGIDEFHVTTPNIYARGLLFGKMELEIGDVATVKSRDYTAEIEFKTKTMFGGGAEENEICGKIKLSTGEVIYKIGGSWSRVMHITSIQTGKQRIIFDTAKHVINHYLLITRPLVKSNCPQSKVKKITSLESILILWLTPLQALAKSRGGNQVR